MIVWSGWGILVLVILFVVGGGVGAGTAALSHAVGLGYLDMLGLALGGFAAAAVNWLVGRHLNGAPGRVLLDPATGQRVVIRRSHSLFFVPMQWWSVPIAVASVLGLLAALFSSPIPSAPTPAGTRASTGAPSTRTPTP